MAFVPNDPNEQNQNNQQANPMTQQAPVTTSSAPGAGPSSGGKASTAQTNPAQPFTNLQAYLTANAPQIQSQADKISGDLSNQYGQVTGDINQGISDFGKQVSGGYAAPNADLVSQAAANPAGFVSNPDNVKAFQGQYNDSYAGPQNFEGSDVYAKTNKEVQDAASKANLVNTLPGLQTYLQGTSPNATQGENTLDTTLLRGNPQAIQQIQTAAKPFASLPDYLSGKVSTADQSVQDAINAANANASNVQNQFKNSVIPGFETGVGTRLTQAQSDAQAQADNAINYLKTLAQSNNPTDAKILSELGVTQDELNQLAGSKDILGTYAGMINPATGQPFYSGNFDFTPYATEQTPSVQITKDKFASPNDYAEAAALQALTGQDMTGFLNPANAVNAGTANLNTLNFDKAKAFQDVQNQVQGQDFAIIKQTTGVDPTKPGALDSLKGYFDNLVTGKVGWPPDPASKARLQMAISGAVRQGLYTYPTDMPHLGIGSTTPGVY